MPLPIQIPINSYTANGVATVFPYQFLLLQNTDLVVTVGGFVKSLTTDYSVGGLGSIGGGNVTFTEAPAAGAVVVLARTVRLDRQTDYQDAGDLLAATLDADFDRLWMALQGLISGEQGGGRIVYFPPGYTGSTMLPDPVPLYVLGWDAVGQKLINYPPGGASGVTVVQGSIPDFFYQQIGIR